MEALSIKMSRSLSILVGSRARPREFAIRKWLKTNTTLQKFPSEIRLFSARLTKSTEGLSVARKALEWESLCVRKESIPVANRHANLVFLSAGLCDSSRSWCVLKLRVKNRRPACNHYRQRAGSVVDGRRASGAGPCRQEEMLLIQNIETPDDYL